MIEILILWISFNNSKVGNVARTPYIEYMKANNINLNLAPIKKSTFDVTTTQKSELSHKVIHEVFRTQFPVTPCDSSQSARLDIAKDLPRFKIFERTNN